MQLEDTKPFEVEISTPLFCFHDICEEFIFPIYLL